MTMIRLVSILSLLVATSVHAQSAVEEQAAEGVGALGITIFALLFFGGCVWYAWLTWRNEKKDREAKAKSERNATS
jgi:cbb3-type cytochrome oxidase subunit 3